MSSYSRSYNEYLGKNRCCDLRGQGPPGPVGPTGPAGIGPVGPAGINTNIFPATYISTTSTLVIASQYNPIAYYSVTLPNAGDAISTIAFGVFPTGYQAIIFVNGTNGTLLDPCVIYNAIANVNINLDANLELTSDSTTKGYATMTIYNFGTNKLCNVIGYNN